MKVLAFCAASFEQSVQRAAGVQPLLSPPVCMDNFEPRLLEGYDLIYLKLHGLPGQPFWYGDFWRTAISDKQVRQADLSGAVVFVANCYLPESPMLAALLNAGPRAVISGGGENYAAPNAIEGTDMLGLWVRRALGWGLNAERALRIGKRRIKLSTPNPSTRAGQAALDALEFQVFGKA